MIALKPLGDQLAQILIFYGHQIGTTRLSSTPSHWQGVIPPDGLVFVVAPGLRRYAGPIDFGRYIAWQQGMVPCVVLDDLKRRTDMVPPLPPVFV